MTDKKVENTILITNVRLSYAYLFKPYKGDDGKSSYCAHSIIAPTHPVLPALTALIRAVAAEEYKDKAEEVLQQIKAQDRLCIHRGDISKPGQDAYRGLLFISANNQVRPRLVATINGVNQEVDESSEFAPYSGCIANVILRIWAQNHVKWGKRFNAELQGVQFVKHAERLGGGGRAASLDEFGVVAGDADSAEPEQGGGGLI
jgi:hypothetical protein